MLDQRRIRWADVVQMLCKYFVLAGVILNDGKPMSIGRIGINYTSMIEKYPIREWKALYSTFIADLSSV